MRYFLIFYQGSVQGWVGLKCEIYPSLYEVHKLVEDNVKNNNFSITNIIELSEQDYNDAIKQD